MAAFGKQKTLPPLRMSRRQTQKEVSTGDDAVDKQVSTVDHDSGGLCADTSGRDDE